MRPDHLVPLPVVLPLIIAALLAGGKKFMPRRLADGLAFVTTLAVGGVCVTLMRATVEAPIVYWFGGWTPRAGVALGISFVATPLSCGLAGFVCLLVAAALMFSWRYFDAIGTLFHALMLVFLAAMCGFSLTGDLFNMFVWFELMSAAAFALCGYKIEEAGPLQGALNFAITNTLGAFTALWGISLLYARTGALNMAQIGRVLGGHPDNLIVTAFVLIACGFFVKAAAFPFHFWLADAHAVAPTPVCVLFSGIMVELGVYAVTRVYWSIMDAPFAAHRPAVRGLFLGVGVITALLGAVMCFGQRHVKRLLAFSTVSHVGLLIIGFALLEPAGLAGAALYVLGHGLVKGALFLCSGILLHRLGSIDEIDLRGHGRHLRGTAAIWFMCGLGLAGMPGFATFLGESGIEEAARKLHHGWIEWIFFAAGALTAAAVFRVGGGVFAGWGAHGAGVLEGAKKIEEKRETHGARRRIPISMALPATVATALAIAIGVAGPGVRHAAAFAAAELADYAGYQARVLDGAVVPVNAPEVKPIEPEEFVRGFGATLTAIGIAAASLSRPRRRVVHDPRPTIAGGFILQPLRKLHSGHIGDYATFFTFGVAALGTVLIVLLHVL